MSKFYTDSTPNLPLARKFKIWAWVATLVVMVFVGARRSATLDFLQGWFTPYQPLLHALLNSLAAVLLVVALFAIKKGNVALHKKLMLAALGASCLFLLSYVVYHLAVEPIRYGGAGMWRGVYFFILFSHIGLAAVSFPFILYSFIYAVTNQLEKHRRLVRWVFPLWLYVAVTGPLVYLMLRPYY